MSEEKAQNKSYLGQVCDLMLEIIVVISLLLPIAQPHHHQVPLALRHVGFLI